MCFTQKIFFPDGVNLLLSDICTLIPPFPPHPKPKFGFPPTVGPRWGGGTASPPIKFRIWETLLCRVISRLLSKTFWFCENMLVPHNPNMIYVLYKENLTLWPGPPPSPLNRVGLDCFCLGCFLFSITRVTKGYQEKNSSCRQRTLIWQRTLLGLNSLCLIIVSFYCL